MHMTGQFVSAAVGGAFIGISGAAVSYSALKLKRAIKSGEQDFSIKKASAATAFVFAAQMINFTIPATGSSGHFVGGLLLAALLGPYAGLISMATILMTQCLFFADGGLLAYGCNLFNMGIIPCFMLYPLFKRILGDANSKTRQTTGSLIVSVLGLQLGAAAVAIQTAASGITALPAGKFAAYMLPIHLAIGLVEGFVTAGVLRLLQTKSLQSSKNTVVALTTLTGLCALVLVLFASSFPDGLEWSVANAQSGLISGSFTGIKAVVQNFQDKLAIFPEYTAAFAKNMVAGDLIPGIAGCAIAAAGAVLGFFGLKAGALRKKAQ